MSFSFAEIKIFIFRPKTLDYNPWFGFWSPKKIEKSVSIYITRKEKSNGACFSHVAPSSEEL